ncbi:MAG: AraC family transcriptional regulator [Fibrobacteres bacterium]|nr:AraC family transcriptional regulator [Fibrobacterota bacterium]
MDKTTNPAKIYRSELFRTPLTIEKKLGIWIDRTGSSRSNAATVPAGYRILGLYAFVNIVKGRGFFCTDSADPQPLSSGNIIVLTPKTPHRYFPETEWETRWIVFGGPEAAQLEKAGCFKSDNTIWRDKRDIFGTTFESINSIMDKEDLSSIIFRKSMLLSLIADLYTAQFSIQKSKENSLIENAINELKKRYTEKNALIETVRQSGLSENHFRRIFKKYAGISPKAFVLNQKINHAKELLSKGCSIKETSLMLNFDDLFYFMRLFKKLTGISPGKYL